MTKRATESSARIAASGAAGSNDVGVRRAREDDLAACFAIWRDALNGYILPLNQPPIPDDVPSVTRLHRHLLATDPERFVVATDERSANRIIGFASAVRRGDMWFLSMLFVAPAHQRRGVGHALLDAVLPRDGAVLATATDSAQPISNALYARLGIVPRMPIFSVVGRPEDDAAFPPLPRDVEAVSFEALGADEGAAIIDELDREVLGYTHPLDHAFGVAEGRRGFFFRRAGSEHPAGVVGYGYASEVGRIGPVAVRDPALLSPVTGELVRAIVPRGASAVWVPGAAGDTLAALLEAGFRLEGFPVLLCWSRPFADFARYLPISPGLL